MTYLHNIQPEFFGFDNAFNSEFLFLFQYLIIIEQSKLKFETVLTLKCFVPHGKSWPEDITSFDTLR